MTQPGGYIGFNRVSTTTAASGIWTLSEAEALRRAGEWPRGPVAPTSLTATAGNAQLSLTWTAPATTHGTIANYLVEYTPSGGSAAYVLTGSTGTSYTLTGLTNGTSYSVRVAAVNFTAGDYSGAAAATPVALAFTAIPEMTSNTAPSGTVLTFGDVRNGGLTDGTAAAWFWFSRRNSGGSSLGAGAQPVNVNNSGIGYQFASGQSLVSGFQIAQSSRVENHYAASFVFSGSDDGVTWTTISTHSGLSGPDGGAGFWEPSVVRIFNLPSPVGYSRYRWMITSAPNTYVEWSQVQLRQ